MNSPEEKAKAILNKIEGVLDGSLPTGDEPYLKETIRIGLFCVDEIIAESLWVANPDTQTEPWKGPVLKERQKYWQKVKEAIQSL